MRSLVRSTVLALAVSAAGLVSAAPARADGGDLLMAEVLFRDGRDLLAHKDYARACPKLAESYRLDPATGTLLALALCHEGQGKLASAWGEYVDAASRARVERRPDRESAARTRAAELESKYSTLTIVLGDGAALSGLEIRRNGAVVAPAWLGTAIPIDGGTVTVDVAAPGHPAWRTQIAIGGVGDHRTLVVPSLDAPSAPARAPGPPQAPAPPAPVVVAPPPPAAAAPAPVAAPAVAAESPSVLAAAPGPSVHRGLKPMQIGGIVVSAIGVAGIGVGATFGLVAMQKNDDSRSQCMGDFCTDAGKQSRKDAISAGNVATAAFIAGPIVAAIGAALIVVGSRGETAPGSAPLQAIPLLGPGMVGGSLHGTF